MTDIDLAKVSASWGAEGGTWAVLVHGGAGELARGQLPRHIEGCRAAAEAAAEVLLGGGRALDAVERAVVVLEDNPSFNAGTGACLNVEGRIELDAAIMEGAGLRGGGVCAMPPFLHPIAIARAVLDDGRHCLYAAHGAARFAVERGFVPSSDEAMTSAGAREQWAAAHSTDPRAVPSAASAISAPPRGTVGAVARDAHGSVASATSTGGQANKRVGRVGDSPLLGAGTYADDDGGACSATGHGECILRVSLAKSATDLLRGGVHPEEAARAMIRRMGSRVAGAGGLILVDRLGRLGLARNTATMTWAAAGATMVTTEAGF